MTVDKSPVATKLPWFGHVFVLFPNKTQRMGTSHTRSISIPASSFRSRISLRVIAIAGSAGISGSLFYWHVGTYIGGSPVWLVAGLLYAALIGLTAAFVFRFIPKLGAFMELTSISRLLLAVAAVSSPGIAGALTTSPVLNATLVVAGAILVRAGARAARTQSVFQPQSKRPAPIPGGY